MAEALSDDIETTTTTSPVSILVNYPGPKSDVQYPLHVQYCGGQFLLLSIPMNKFLVQYISYRMFSTT
jgi:hypothetical protein